MKHHSTRGIMKGLVLCLLAKLPLIQISSSLSHDKQLMFLQTFCHHQLCSSIILYDITDWCNISLKEFQFVKFISQLYLKILVTSTQAWTSCQPLPDGAGKTPLLVLPYRASTQHHEFLKQCSQEGQFNGRILWLFLTSDSLSSHLFQNLAQLNIRLDSNIFIAVYGKEANIQLLETYALGTLGQNTSLQHHIISEWNPGNLVPPSTHKYDRHRHGNLQGYQLRATTVLINEFYTQIQKSGDHFQVTGGYFGEVFKTLANALNFTYTIIYLPGYSYGNTPTDNTSMWTGMIGAIQKQEADLSICEVSITADRLEVIDFTLPLHTAATQLYVHEGTKEPSMDWYFHPFNVWTWFALIVGLLLFTSINNLLHYITYNLHGSTQRSGFLSNLFTTVTIMLQQGTDSPSSFSMRLVQHSSALLFLVVHIAYSAKLTSLATLYKPQPPLGDLSDILKSSSWKFGVMNSSLPFNTFKNAEPGSIFGKLWHLKLEPFPGHLMNSYTSGLSATLAGSHFAFLGLEDSCQNTLQHSFTPAQACKILALPHKYFRGGLSFALQKNSPYKEVINHSILKMKSIGLIQRLKLKWVPQPQQCNKMLYVVMEWTDILLPVRGFIAIVLTSLFILIAELMLYKYRTVMGHHKKKSCANTIC